MKKVVLLVMVAVLVLSGCGTVPTEKSEPKETTTTTKAEPKWQDEFPDKLAHEIESAFAEIGENPDNIIKVTYIKTSSTGYIFEQKDYKVEFSWSFGNPGYNHSRYYRITTQNYFEGEPEKAEYPDEFLATIKYWVGDDGFGTNVNQWAWTGNGEKQ